MNNTHNHGDELSEEFPIVGIGASAGGLAAFEQLFTNLPPNSGMAFVVVQHEHLIEDIQKVLNDLVPKAIDVQAKDGTWFLINIKPYRTLELVIDGAVITFVDITDQKRGDVLRRLGTILQDSNDAITMQYFEGKILAWNRGAALMYGWSEAEALQMNILNIVPKARLAGIRDLYQRLSNGEVIQSLESLRLTRDGRILTVWLTLTTLFNDASQPICIATTERDFTGRKQLERKDA